MNAPVTIITAQGDLGLREIRKISAAVAALAERERAQIVIECSGADSVEIAALAAIVKVANFVEQNGGQLKFARSSQFVRAVFDRYLGDRFEHYASIEDALLSFDEEWDGDDTNH